MAESANHEHLQQMANLAREAQLALQRQAEEHQLALQLALQREAVTHAENMVRHHAAQSLKVSQLEMALELQENKNVRPLARKGREREDGVARAWRADRSPKHSSPDSAHYHDVMSDSGSVKAQLGCLASLAASVVNPFANTFGNTTKTSLPQGGLSSQNTCDLTTPGVGGSQSSQAYAFPIDLFDVSPQIVTTFGQTSTTYVQPTHIRYGDEGDDQHPTPNPDSSDSPPQGGFPNHPSNHSGNNPGGGDGDGWGRWG